MDTPNLHPSKRQRRTVLDSSNIHPTSGSTSADARENVSSETPPRININGSTQYASQYPQYVQKNGYHQMNQGRFILPSFSPYGNPQSFPYQGAVSQAPQEISRTIVSSPGAYDTSSHVQVKNSRTSHHMEKFSGLQSQNNPRSPSTPIFSEFSSEKSSHSSNAPNSTKITDNSSRGPSFTRLPVHLLVHESNDPGTSESHTEACESYPKIPEVSAIKSSGAAHFADPLKNNTLQHDVEVAFRKLVPLLANVTAQNVCGVLTDIVKQHGNSMTLDDVYQLLYNPQVLDFDPASTSTQNEPKSSSDNRLKELRLCHRILTTFENPLNAGGLLGRVDLERLSSSYISHSEIPREFLALKIILSSVQKVEYSFNSQFCIPRISFYKVYYILCQKLIRKHAALLSTTGKSPILGQSQFGKLTKLAFPDLASKRLGRRGHSKFHYIGLTWNTSVVGEDIVGLLDLEMVQIEEYFKNLPKQKHPNVHYSNNVPRAPTVHATQNPAPELTPISKGPLTNPSSISKPKVRSFVRLSNKYPNFNCSPRLWNTTPNEVPRQSPWAANTMEKSVEILQHYNLELLPLISNVKAGKFPFGNNSSLSSTLVNAMTLLSRASAPKEAYLHLYLVILLLVFPVAIASDEEVADATKIEFRKSMNDCIATLESEVSNLPFIDQLSLSIFTRLLRKMVDLNEMTSGKTKFSYTGSVVSEMVHDLDSAIDYKADGYSDISLLDETYIESISMSLNAYNLQPVDESASKGETSHFSYVCTLAKTFIKAIMMTKESMAKIPLHANGSQSVPRDAAYQVLKLALKNFHESTLTEPMVLNLPMLVVTFVLVHNTSSMQYANFHDFEKRDPELSKQTFKCWWMFSTMLQEYVSIIQEVVALSASLS
ncbi:hypothetical protein JCM33374_g1271 [Metschnikowia sp. JCM 33374]|nr:hypothetical protein JCM33374_g1271 [Metschnikowia sp. JCM 33374]